MILTEEDIGARVRYSLLAAKVDAAKRGRRVDKRWVETHYKSVGVLVALRVPVQGLALRPGFTDAIVEWSARERGVHVNDGRLEVLRVSTKKKI